MNVFPEGIKFKDLINLIILAFSIWKKFGFRTLSRKVSYKLSRREEPEYDLWRKKNEPGEDEFKEQLVASRAFFYRPLISFITPVFNPPVPILKACIDSVLCQTYENWELCIADGSDSSSRPEIKTLIDQYIRNDGRIKVNYLNENSGISINSNKALELAKGEFIALIDHDDQIAPFALFRIVERLNQDRDIDLLYSDRDLLSWDGKKRSHPFFKPDWSQETLVSVNYLIHLTVIRKSMVDKAGGFLAEMDGAQDWDLFFRISEITSKIVHIPEILYHWRVGPHSASWSLTAKPYVVQAQFRAVNKHFKRLGIDVEVFHGASGFLRIKWNNAPPAKVSIILISQSIQKILEKSLKIILAKTRFPDFEIVLVDNKAEGPAIQQILRRDPIRHVNPPTGLTLPELRTFGAEKSAGQILVFMSDDLEVLDSDWLEELSGWAVQREIGAVAGKILNADGTLQSTGLIKAGDEEVILPFSGLKEYYGRYGSSEWYRNYSALSWDCLAVRKEVFEGVLGFDRTVSGDVRSETFFPRLQKNGYRLVYSPYVRLRHHG